jgi:hypothetical protein
MAWLRPPTPRLAWIPSYVSRFVFLQKPCKNAWRLHGFLICIRKGAVENKVKVCIHSGHCEKYELYWLDCDLQKPTKPNQYKLHIRQRSLSANILLLFYKKCNAFVYLGYFSHFLGGFMPRIVWIGVLSVVTDMSLKRPNRAGSGRQARTFSDSGPPVIRSSKKAVENLENNLYFCTRPAFPEKQGKTLRPPNVFTWFL